MGRRRLDMRTMETIRSRCTLRGTVPPAMLMEYIKKDSEAGMFVCQFCGKANLQKNNIRKHIEGVHFKGHFIYKCEMCNKDFNGKHSLSVHLSRFHGNSANK